MTNLRPFPDPGLALAGAGAVTGQMHVGVSLGNVLQLPARQERLVEGNHAVTRFAGFDVDWCMDRSGS